jgi:uncharacterized protein
MMLSIELALIAGLLIGMLGGGGSLLLVPILVYTAKLSGHDAIRVSLVVVAVTSAVAMLSHARRGAVLWRKGFGFIVSGALGSYAGSYFSRWLPSWLLMLSFSLLVLTAALAMLRKKKAEMSIEAPQGQLLVLGTLLGAVTGLLGAGGGFLIVPVLVRFVALPMPQAIGTSLFIIMMNSMTALMSHMYQDFSLPEITIYIALSSVLGAILGAFMSQKVSAERLRTYFAWFLLFIAAFLFFQQLPASWLVALRGPWPAWVGGLSIGGFVLLFLYFQNQALGVSTGYLDVCQYITTPRQKATWRLPFLVGIVLGGFISALLSGGLALNFSAGLYDLVASSLWAKALLFTSGGVLLGYGSRVAGGCTSGHSIVGIAQLAPSSIITTLAFMATGFAVTNLLLRAVGGLA